MDPLQSLMQPLTQAQGIGGMLQGLGAGFAGQPDPRLAQQDAAFKQKLQLSQLQRSVEDQRTRRAQMQLGIGRTFLEQDSPIAKKIGAKIMGDQARKLGMDLPQGFEEGLVGSPLSLDKRKDVYTSILAAQGNPTLIAQLPDYLGQTYGIPKTELARLTAEAQSDPIHKLLYGKTPAQEQLEIQKAGLEQQKFDLLLSRQDLADQRQKLSEVKEDRLRTEGQAKLDLMERNTQAREDALALANKKFEWATAHGPEEKRVKALDQAELLANQMSSYSGQLDTQGFLPKTDKGVVGGLTTGDSSAAMAKIKRTTDYNNPAWRTWKQHLQPAMIGYARSVQNDIGPRAMAAFQGAIQLMDDPPSKKAVEEVIGNMRKAIALGRAGNDTAQTLYIRHPSGQVVVVPWKRGMAYDEGDTIVRIE